MDEPTDPKPEIPPVKSGYGPDVSYEPPDSGGDTGSTKTGGYGPDVSYDEPPDTGSTGGGSKSGGYPGPLSE